MITHKYKLLDITVYAYFVLHLVSFTDYAVYVPYLPILRMVPLFLFIMIKNNINKTYVIVTIILFIYSLLYLYKLNYIDYSYRILHYVLTVYICSYIAYNYEYYKMIISNILLSLIILSIISIYVDLRVDNFEERIGYGGIVQFSGIMNSPPTLGWICILYSIINIYNKKSNKFILIITTYVGIITLSRQYIINILLLLYRYIFVKVNNIILSYITSTIAIVTIIIVIINTGILFLGDIDQGIMGNRTSLYNSFINDHYIEALSLGIGYGNVQNYLFTSIGKSYSFHNAYMTFAIEWGIVGIAVLIIFVIYVIYIDIKKIKKSYLILSQFLLAAMFTSVFDYSTALLSPFFFIYLLTTLYGKNIFHNDSVK